MKIKDVLSDVKIKKIIGSKEINVTGISNDSRRIVPGYVFIARNGKNFDATQFIDDAIAFGAKVIISDLYNPFLNEEVTQVICDDILKVEGKIAANYYQFPSEKLFSVGITGTNGKTTTSYLVRHILENVLLEKCGLIGTVESIVGDKHFPSPRTTMDVVSNQKMLADMVQSNCRAVVMETTSHGLDQNRLDYINYDAIIFTNITQDHFDYHKTFENYFACKKKLLLHLKKNGVVVINKDDENFKKMLEDIRDKKVIDFGINEKAQLQAIDLKLTAEGTEFLLLYKEQKIKVKTQLIGRFNVYNILGAIGAALVFGLPLEKIIDAIDTFTNVPGRMQRVENNKKVNVFVDFAHTETALLNVLSTLQELKHGKIITVFGCGGDRDKDKRPKMGKVAEQFSNLTFVTLDNPRSEDPANIVQDIICGFSNPKSYIVEMDRRVAIERAFAVAQEGDIVLIAGKGHEKKQIFKDKILEFDDFEIASGIMNR